MIEKKHTVASGIFEGLIYPELISHGSSLPPKMLGTYENELDKPILKALASKPNIVVNVGCGEGYYAAGIARILKNTPVHAYDVSDSARDSCAKMAEANSLDKLQIKRGKFSHDTYEDEPGLLLVDIEGDELELFAHQGCKHLLKWTFIVELHDFINPTISDTLLKSFRETHNVEIIGTKPKWAKAREISDYFDDIPLLDAVNLVDEHRPTSMEWLIATPLDSPRIQPKDDSEGPVKKIHQIWLGQANQPLEHKKWAQSLRQFHPDFEYHLWSDQEAEEEFPIFKKRRKDFRRNPFLASDLLRYLILHKYGGLYLDTDIEPIKPFSTLTEKFRGFYGIEEQDIMGPACNAVIWSSRPQMSWTEDILNTIPDGELTFENMSIPRFSEAVKNDSELIRLSCDYFYPKNWRGHKNIAKNDRTIAIHHYAHSWK